MDYQGNSDKEKAAKGDKQIVKVVTGEVSLKPESVGRKFKKIFFGGDLKTSAKFVAADVMLPAFRNLLLDAIINGARGVIHGDTTYRQRSPEYRPTVNYSNPIRRSMTMYRDSRDRRPYLPDQPHPYRNQGNVDRSDIIFEKKSDAELVVERLIDIVDKFEVASLADYYDLCGVPSSHVDNKWGWTYLNKVDINSNRDGFYIELPPLEVI
ncbi:MAG: hypothetical protein ABW007_24335 [Chitinophagaceae bacterium]